MAWLHAVLPSLGAFGVALLLVVAICFWPLRFDVSGQARGEADGSWVVAGGVSLSAVSLAFVTVIVLAPLSVRAELPLIV